MPTVKILLGRLSPEWGRLLIQLADSDDKLEIVGTIEDPVGLLIEVEKLKADVVVLSQLPSGSEPGICSHLVLEHPNVRVFLLPGGQGRNLPFSLVLRKEWLKDVSAETLRHALRASSRRTPGYAGSSWS